MHYIISATMRIALGTLMLLGVCLFVLLGLLSLIRELFADENHREPTLADDDSRPRDSRAPQVGPASGAALSRLRGGRAERRGTEASGATR
jgi:hypothetical protein